LEIAYSIGVSLASSVHGVPRLTFDVDLVADLNPGQIDDLAEQLASDFYVDRLTITEALRLLGLQRDPSCERLQI
jgi:hypothetical protein